MKRWCGLSKSLQCEPGTKPRSPDSVSRDLTRHTVFSPSSLRHPSASWLGTFTRLLFRRSCFGALSLCTTSWVAGDCTGRLPCEYAMQPSHCGQWRQQWVKGREAERWWVSILLGEPEENFQWFERSFLPIVNDSCIGIESGPGWNTAWGGGSRWGEAHQQQHQNEFCRDKRHCGVQPSEGIKHVLPAL